MDMAVAAPSRIGPNAITRVAEALNAQLGELLTTEVFAAAGLLHHLASPPTHMVDEAEVTRLHRVLRSELGERAAFAVARDAGLRTGDYLLGHRIPRPVQWLLKLLPPTLASRVLLSAIHNHAWTFAGSGSFSASAGLPVVLTIHGNPMCAGQTSTVPICDFYAATFERLFRVLVDPQTSVREVACEARGDDACRFELRW